MKRLSKVSLVQFFLYDSQDISISGNTAFVGHNGSGKSTLLDAIQIVLMGVNQHYLSFNSQAIGRGRRTVRDYCLGVTLQDGIDGKPTRAREIALSYITLTFRDEKTDNPITLGACISARGDNPKHEVEGLFVVNGLELQAADMLDNGSSGDMPMSWRDFEHAQRASAKAGGHTFEVASNAKDFIKKYLHHLQDRKLPIDFEPYLPALKESLQLRYTDDIDGFVRHHLISANPIDVAKCSRQIKDFEELRRIVEDIERRLADLEAIDVRFRGVQDVSERVASISAVKARVSADEYHESVERGMIHLHAIDEEVAQCENDLLQKKDEQTAADADLERVMLHIARDLNATKRVTIDQQIAEAVAGREKAANALESSLDELNRTLQSMPRSMPITTSPEYVNACNAVQQARRNPKLTNVDFEGIADIVVPFLNRAYNAAESRWAEADERVKTAENGLLALEGRLRSVQSGGSDLRYAGALMEVLAQRGIKATPVCDLVRITDVEWQPVIEAFLGKNRESLVVQPNDEEAAIDVTRTIARNVSYDTTIVQSFHLRDMSQFTEPGYAGALIAGDNKTAVDYVLGIFGRMRCVETNAELRTTSRAMTRDGMLSASGGTKPIRLPRREDLMFGKRRDTNTANRLHSHIQQAKGDLVRLRNDRESLSILKRRLAPMAADRFGDLLFTLADDRDKAIARLEALEESKKALTSGRAADLVQLQERAKQKRDKVRREVNDLVARQSRAHQEQITVSKTLDACRGLLRQSEQDLAKLIGDPFYNEKMADDIYAQVVKEFATTAQRVRSCENLYKRADDERNRRIVSALGEFRKYTERDSAVLGQEYDDWNIAREWVCGELIRLRDTNLVQRKAEAEEARRLAQESFHRDVAVNLRDRIQKMRIYLTSLDSILKKCPPFSNGERYRFEARPRDDMRAVLDLIERSSRIDAPNLFETTELQETVSRLLEESGREGSAIDISDYRTFFKFDLTIEQDGKAIGRLSARMGAGSGGEHRTPLFVVAGAALATAYRIDVTHPNDTFGLMLVDEAFYGMDPQNSLAVARFLSSIGLQIVMAGPDGDVSKFAPFCDRIYDMARFGEQIIMIPADLSEHARDLMASDMPAEHPELVKAEIDRTAIA